MKAFFRPLIFAAVLAAVAVSLPAGAANTAANAKQKVIRACVAKNGSVRIIGANGRCQRGQKLLTWNQVGQAGPTGQGVPGQTGATGPQGPAGATGAAGAVGATGANGAAGAAGATGAQGEKGDPGTNGTNGAQGPQGDPGAAGADGAPGANLAGQILFSTGLNNLGANYVGVADSEPFEAGDVFGNPKYGQGVQQIVAVSGHITAMYCQASAARTADTTYTLRINAADTAATCTIAINGHTGSATGLNVAFSAGDLLDVASPAANGGGKGNFAVAVGP